MIRHGKGISCGNDGAITVTFPKGTSTRTKKQIEILQYLFASMIERLIPEGQLYVEIKRNYVTIPARWSIDTPITSKVETGEVTCTVRVKPGKYKEAVIRFMEGEGGQ
jgi:hypothetical protein